MPVHLVGVLACFCAHSQRRAVFVDTSSCSQHAHSARDRRARDSSRLVEGKTISAGPRIAWRGLQH
eukprot:15042935-Alexandrium_andersonii.AAC.1